MFGMVLAVGLVLPLAITALAQSSIEVFDAVEVADGGRHLTSYQDGVFLVEDTRTFDLEAGRNRLVFDGVPSHIWRDTVALSATQGAGRVTLVGQTYVTVEPPFNIDMLAVGNIGETVTLTVFSRDATDDSTTDYTGTLLSVANSVYALQVEDGTIFTFNRGEIRAFQLPQTAEEPVRMPTLELTVDSSVAGDHTLTITYLSDGITWQNASYNLRLGADGESLDVTGWIVFQNNAGVDFNDVGLTLGGSGVNRVQFVAREQDFALPTASPTVSPTPTPGGMPNTGGGGPGGGFNPGAQLQPPEFMLDLPNPVTLMQNETSLVEFLAGVVVNPNNVYVYDASPRVFGYSSFINNPDYGVTDINVVQNFLTFATGTEEEPGIALPAGDMRIYQEEADGATLLIGQPQLAYVPSGEVVQVFLNNPETLSGVRVQDDFETLSNNAVQETIEITLRNDGDEDITVRVPERMTRSRNWEILGANMPFEQPDSFGVEFIVEVPAGEQTVITYTVLYTG